MKQVHTLASEDEAQNLRQFLIANGTEASVINDESARQPDDDATSLSTWCVVVHDDDYNDARIAIERFTQPIIQTATATNNGVPTPASSRSLQWQWRQLAVVLLLTQPWYSPTYFLLWGSIANVDKPSFAQEWVIDVCWFALVTLIVLLAIRFGGERLSTYGLKSRDVWSDLLTGSLAFICALVVSIIGIDMFKMLATDMLGKRYEAPELFRYWMNAPRNARGLLALLVVSILIGLAEELVFRSFLITTLERLLKSTWWSVVLAAVYFGACHAYAGVLHIWYTFLIGLVFGIAFVWTRRVWPLVFAHALVDFAAFIAIRRN